MSVACKGFRQGLVTACVEFAGGVIINFSHSKVGQGRNNCLGLPRSDEDMTREGCGSRNNARAGMCRARERGSEGATKQRTSQVPRLDRSVGVGAGLFFGVIYYVMPEQ
jgi:hypothetical protein